MKNKILKIMLTVVMCFTFFVFGAGEARAATTCPTGNGQGFTKDGNILKVTGNASFEADPTNYNSVEKFGVIDCSSYDEIIVNSGKTLTMKSYIVNDVDSANDFGVMLKAKKLTINTGGVMTAVGQGYSIDSSPLGKDGISTAGMTGIYPEKKTLNVWKNLTNCEDKKIIVATGGGGGGYINLLGGKDSGCGSDLALAKNDAFCSDKCSDFNAKGGVSHEKEILPNDLGSAGGGVNGDPNVGGQGGGAIKLYITDTLTINGKILVYGDKGSSKTVKVEGQDVISGGGGGAGGTVHLFVKNVQGNGKINAFGGDGGVPNDLGGEGGGGAGGYVMTAVCIADATEDNLKEKAAEKIASMPFFSGCISGKCANINYNGGEGGASMKRDGKFTFIPVNACDENGLPSLDDITNEGFGYGQCVPFTGKTELSENTGKLVFFADGLREGREIILRRGQAMCIREASGIIPIYGVPGWVWSTSVGWMSFNLEDWTATMKKQDIIDSVCATASNKNNCRKNLEDKYGVEVHLPYTSTYGGFLRKYAWIPKAGWVSFEWMTALAEKPKNQGGAGYVYANPGKGYAKFYNSGEKYCLDICDLNTGKLKDPNSGYGNLCNYCQYIPKIESFGGTYGNWELKGFAWSDNLGWINLKGGAQVTGWTPLKMYVKFYPSKVFLQEDGTTYEEKDALGQKWGFDGVRDDKVYNPMDGTTENSNFAVAGYPLRGGYDFDGNGTNNWINGCIGGGSEGLPLRELCRYPISGYRFNLELGFTNLEAAKTLMQNKNIDFDNAVVKIEGSEGGIYPKQNDESKNMEIISGTALTNQDSALLWGPEPKPTSPDPNKPDATLNGNFFLQIRKAEDVTVPTVGSFRNDPNELDPLKTIPIYKDRLWVKTVASATPSYRPDMKGSLLENDLISPENTFKIKQVYIKIPMVLDGVPDDQEFFIEAKDINLKDDETNSYSIYEGEVRFRSPVKIKTYQLMKSGAANRYIQALINQESVFRFDDLTEINNNIPNGDNFYKYINPLLNFTLVLPDPSVPTAESSKVKFVFADSAGRYQAGNDNFWKIDMKDYAVDSSDAKNWYNGTSQQKKAMPVWINESDPETINVPVKDPKMVEAVKYKVQHDDNPSVAGLDVDLNAVFRPDFLPDPTELGTVFDPGLKVRGGVSIKRQTGGKTGKELTSIGDMSTNMQREQLIKNIAKWTKGITTGTAGLNQGITFSSGALSVSSGNGQPLAGGKGYYFLNTASLCAAAAVVKITGTTNAVKNQTIIVEGADLMINKDIYNDSGGNALGIIVLAKKINGILCGGRLYIGQDVTTLDAHVFTDGPVFRYYSVSPPACQNYRDNNTEYEPCFPADEDITSILNKQFYLRGSFTSGALFSGNTIGGTDLDIPILGNGQTVTRTVADLERAAKYDLNKFSYFRPSLIRCNSNKGFLDLQTGTCKKTSTEIKDILQEYFDPWANSDGNNDECWEKTDDDDYCGDLFTNSQTELSNLYNIGNDTAFMKKLGGTESNKLYSNTSFVSQVITDSEVLRSPLLSTIFYDPSNKAKVRDYFKYLGAVYFDFKAPPVSLPGFESAGGGATMQY